MEYDHCTARDRESVNWTIKLKVPDWVGVPVMAPPDDSVKPGGNDVPDTNDQVFGGVNAPPVVENDWL